MLVRGKGIGSRAIIFAENRLKELNYKISHIGVKKPNKYAIAFYKKMGFTETNPYLDEKDIPDDVKTKVLKELFQKRMVI